MAWANRWLSPEEALRNLSGDVRSGVKLARVVGALCRARPLAPWTATPTTRAQCAANARCVVRLVEQCTYQPLPAHTARDIAHGRPAAAARLLRALRDQFDADHHYRRLVAAASADDVASGSVLPPDTPVAPGTRASPQQPLTPSTPTTLSSASGTAMGATPLSVQWSLPSGPGSPEAFLQSPTRSAPSSEACGSCPDAALGTTRLRARAHATLRASPLAQHPPLFPASTLPLPFGDGGDGADEGEEGEEDGGINDGTNDDDEGAAAFALEDARAEAVDPSSIPVDPAGLGSSVRKMNKDAQCSCGDESEGAMQCVLPREVCASEDTRSVYSCPRRSRIWRAVAVPDAALAATDSPLASPTSIQAPSARLSRSQSAAGSRSAATATFSGHRLARGADAAHAPPRFAETLASAPLRQAFGAFLDARGAGECLRFVAEADAFARHARPRAELLAQLGTLHGAKVHAVLYVAPEQVGQVAPEWAGQWDAVLVANDALQALWHLYGMGPRPRDKWVERIPRVY